MGTHVTELAALTSTALCGGKAFRLGELLRAGFRVPPGFVITFDQVGESVDAATANEIEKRATLLGDAISVRSSASTEDREDTSAPGLYLSVAPSSPAQVLGAVEAVRASAMSTSAQRYAELTRTPFPSPMAVVVGRYIEASAAGTLYLEKVAALDPESGSVQQPKSVATIERRLGRALSEEQRTTLRDLGRCVSERLKFERLDLEWVIDKAGKAWTVQARRLPESGAVSTKIPPPLGSFSFAASMPTQLWQWDVTHNPLPLSIAHRGLVDWVVEHADAKLAVAAGYLYEATYELTDKNKNALTDGQVATDLESVFFADVGPTLDALLLASEVQPANLTKALEVFSTVFRIYGDEIGPRVALAKKRRGKTQPMLQPSLGAGLFEVIAKGNTFGSHAIEYARSQAVDEASYWFAHSPRWDIAEPCLSENVAGYSAFCSKLVNRRHERPKRSQPNASMTQRLADLAHAVGELDDRLFYRAQRGVRRAILNLPGDIRAVDRFFLPLSSLLNWATGGVVPKNASERILENKKLWNRESGYAMPAAVRGTNWNSTTVRAQTQTILSGRGRGGQATGRVHRTDHPTTRAVAPPPGSIIVASSLSPGEIVLCAEALGVVLQTDRLLGHAAAMATELDIPIVVGVPVGGLRDGELIWLDGAAGTVIRSLR